MADSVKTIEEEYEDLAGDNSYYELAEIISRMNNREKADGFIDILIDDRCFVVLIYISLMAGGLLSLGLHRVGHN